MFFKLAWLILDIEYEVFYQSKLSFHVCDIIWYCVVSVVHVFCGDIDEVASSYEYHC